MLYLALCRRRLYLFLLGPFLFGTHLLDKVLVHIDLQLGMIKELLEVLTPFIITISGIKMHMVQLVLHQFLQLNLGIHLNWVTSHTNRSGESSLAFCLPFLLSIQLSRLCMILSL